MAFSDQALSKFLQSHPRLANNMMSFSDLTDQLKEEDGNTAFGVFILKSGEEYFFAPALSRNDVMYPIDMVYFNSDQKFFPLSESVKTMITSLMPARMGLATKTPNSVVKNPSVADLIRPPRTGKFAYASSRLEEVLATSPQHIRDGLKNQIQKEASFQEPLNRMFGLRNIFDSLTVKTAEENTEETEKKASYEFPAPKVVSEGQGLPEHVIQDILEHGYGIMGEPANPRVVATSYHREHGPTKYRRIDVCDAGASYEVLTKTGKKMHAAVPHVFNSESLPSYMFFDDGTYKAMSKHDREDSFIAVGEPGTASEAFDTILENVPPVRLGNIYPDLAQAGRQQFAIFYEEKLVGIFHLSNRLDENGVTKFKVANHGKDKQIIAIDGLTTTPTSVEGTYYVSKDLVCLPVCHSSVELEQSLLKAQALDEAKLRSDLTQTCSIRCDGPEFYMNGDLVGDEKDMASQLVVEESVPKETTMALIKSAKDQGSVRFYMSKPMDKSAASHGSHPGEIPSYGQEPTDDNTVYPDQRIRQSMEPAMQTNDPSIVESTLVSEILQDPNMFDTIEGYLPDIAKSVDRLGRVLLITRLHSDIVFGETDATETTALLSAVKNSFKMLGDNYLTLERLVANARIAS